MNRCIKIGRWFLVLAVIYFLGRTIFQQWHGINLENLFFDPLLFQLSLFLFTAFYISYGLSWYSILHRLLKRQNHFLSRRLMLRFFFNGLLVRYLPAGKIFNVGVRSELLVSRGIARGIALKSLLLEQYYFICSALVMFVVIAAVFSSAISDTIKAKVLLLIAVVLLLFLIKKIVRRVGHAAQTIYLRPIFWCQYFGVNLLQGGAVVMLLCSLSPGGMGILNGELSWAIIAYPISRVVGQLAVVLPGGIGLRETAYVALMAPFVPVEPLLVTVTLARLISILLESILFLCFLVPSSK